MATIEEYLTQIEAATVDAKQDAQNQRAAMEQLLSSVAVLNSKVDIAIMTLTDLRNHSTDPAILERIAKGLADIQATDEDIETATAQADQASQQLDAASQRLTQAATPTPAPVVTPTAR